MLVFVDSSQIEVRVGARFVALGGDGFLKPGNRIFPFFLLDQVGADIVVRIAEIRIDLDPL